MKTPAVGLCVLLVLGWGRTSALRGQTAQASAPPATPYRVVNRGADFQEWQSESYEVLPNGQTVAHSHKYTELASGLNYLDPATGQWKASQELIESYPQGALAQQGPHKLIFATDLNTAGAIDEQTQDGKRLRSNLISLMYYDPVTGQSAQIAQIQNSEGQLIANNQVLYTNAFNGNGIRADVLYTYRRDGMDQSVILRTRLPAPASLGIQSDAVELVAVTEFLDPPEATVWNVGTDATGLEPDQAVSWGATCLGHGKAFSIGAQDAPAPVIKQYVNLDGHYYLLEKVRFNAVERTLSTLPDQASNAAGKSGMASRHLRFPKTPGRSSSKRPLKIAWNRPSEPGYVLDYVSLNVSTNNVTFYGDTTYYISGNLNLAGTNYFEQNTVLKYAPNASLTAVAGSQMRFLSQPYRPISFTAVDDNTIGETISGSTGNPSGYYANPALGLAPTSPVSLANFRIAYASRGISASTANVKLSDAQLVSCATAVSDIGSPISLENVLLSNIKTNFNASSSTNVISVQNATFNNSFALLGGQTNNPVCLTNCVLVNVTNVSASCAGGYNGFYRTPAFGWPYVSTAAYPLQTAGAASCYLTNGCAFLSQGTTNIDPVLLADLATKTTFAPIVYTSAALSAPTNFGPQAQRDYVGSPTPGFHYCPLDYAFGNSTAASNLTFAAGTAAAWFFTSSGGTYGLAMGDSATAAFNGTASVPCYFVNYETVQEGGNGNWQAESWMAGLTGQSYTHAAPGMTAEFTVFSAPATETGPYSDNHGSLFIFRGNNCEFYSAGGGAYFGSHNVTNCLYVNAGTGLWDNYGNASETFEGCTFIRGNVFAVNPSSGAWPLSIYNCAFAGTTISLQTSYGNTNGYYTDYNSFLLHSNQTPYLGGHEITNILAYNWQSSWFGNYYLPPGSPLIQAGSTNANLLGLYHFTTQTNQVPETNAIVTIGYHYVATDPNGLPLDSNGDGIPDYLEDANGNGLVDNGETNWALAILVQPTNQTAIAGSTIAFYALADGLAPISYQWQFDGTNISGATYSELILPGVQSSQEGNYTVMITNSWGSITSAVAVLTVCTPTLDSISNQTVYAGSGPHSITLTGISAGCSPFQVTGITASSGNTNIVLNPSVAYSSPNNTALLTFIPSATQTGTVTITVILQDSRNTNSINGTFGFIAELLMSPSDNLETITNLILTNAALATSLSASGFFANVFAGTNTASFNFQPLTFTPPTLPVESFMTVTNNGIVFAIDAVSVQLNFQFPGAIGMYVGGICHSPSFSDTPGSINIVGTGSTGEGAIAGTWNFGSPNQISQSFTVTVLPPPLSLTITSPTNSQLFVTSPTNVVLNATAADAGGTITNVEFFNGTNLLGVGAAGGSNTYTFVWTHVPAGSYSLTAEAADNLGDLAITNTAIIVNAMPAVGIASPTNLQAFLEKTNVTITATASDADGTITNVAFYSGTNIIGATNRSPFSVVWSNLVAGYYPVTAIATDDRGASSVSAIEVFNVLPTNPPPFVQITFPMNNATFSPGSDITIAAQAYGTNGGGTVTNVEFFVNNQSIGSDPHAPYELTKCCWEHGTYVLLAKAADNLGNYAISEPVTITIASELPAQAGFWDAAFGHTPVTLMGTTQYFGGDANFASLVVSTNGFIYGDGFGSGSITYPVLVYTNGSPWGSVGPAEGGDDAIAWNTVLLDGTNVYAGGNNAWRFGSLAVRWDGAEWVPLGNQIDPSDTYSVTLARIGGDVYMGGTFQFCGDGSPSDPYDTNVQRIAKLDRASNRWSVVGNGVTNGAVYAIAAVNGVLYIGGSFTAAGGDTNANCIAYLKNGCWTHLGSGLSSDFAFTNAPADAPWVQTLAVYALAVCNTNLFVGGNFSRAGNNTNANGVAEWDTRQWQAIGQGVGPSPINEYYSNVTNPAVFSIAVRGQNVFAGGNFANVFNGSGDSVSANNVAMATWNETTHEWNWSDLDQGVSGDNFDFLSAEVDSMVIAEGASPGSYDLYAGGFFTRAGSSQIFSHAIARWRVGYPQPAAPPRVNITSPASTIIVTNPASITLAGIAVSPNTNIYAADLYTNGVEVGTPQDYSSDNTNIFAFTNIWSTSAPGVYLVTATAQDDNQLVGTSKSIIVDIKNAAGATNAVVAVDDYFTIPVNTPAADLHVLTNDSPAAGLRIGGITKLHNNLGTAAVGYDRTYLVYTPYPNSFGTDVLFYEVTNASGSMDSASVTVNIVPAPVVQIVSPLDGSMIGAGSDVTVAVASSSYDGFVTNIALNVNGVAFSRSGTNASDFSWSTNVPAFYTFTAVATDTSGITNISEPATIAITNSSTATNVLTASIDNLPVTFSALGTPILTVVQDGLFDLRGQAEDSNLGDGVAYQVLLHPPGDPDTVIANVTPQPWGTDGFHPGGDVGGDLGKIDLTAVPNGIYDIELIVRGGGAETNLITSFQLDSNLKIGQFSFSEQDLVLPVNGIPLTVTRTYNSLNPLSSDFGYSWSFALNDMDVQLDDTRQDVVIGTDTVPWDDGDQSDGGLPKTVNMRTGGGWDVTLTLPDGRRETFAFNPQISGDGTGNIYAQWQTPPGLAGYSLTPEAPGSDLLQSFPSLHWANSDLTFGNAPIENQDFPGWLLTTPDGTQYHITRGSPTDVTMQDPNNPGQYISVRAYGPPKLTEIQERSQDTIVINGNGISHYDAGGNPTRSAWFQRDWAGRIVAILDPNGGTNGLPAVQYVYNQDTGNLIQVLKLKDRAAGIYVTNRYDYNNPAFPHYITSIENGDGVPVAQNFYDDSGRLVAVQDANGNLTQFVHSTTNQIDVVIDRLGHTNTYVYDTHGNITAQTNALNQVTLTAYDANDNKTNQITFLDSRPYATNSYTYDDSLNVMLSSTDPLGNTSSFTYDSFGDVLSSTDPRGGTTINDYSPDTGELINTVDALGHGTTNFYGGGLLLGTSDAVGTATTNYYDNLENLTATATLDASGALLASNSFTYDLDGNRTASTLWRKAGGSWSAATTGYSYDALNRVVQTVDPDGGTNAAAYDDAGNQVATTDKLGRATSYLYDGLNRLIRTTYPDQTTATSAYDASGNRTSSTDQEGRATTFVYDALNRLIETIYPDNTTNGTVYDEVGRVARSIDARGTITAYAYDAAGRRLAVTNAFGTSVAMVNQYAYDANGNQTAFTDGLGHTTTTIFDVLNRPVQVEYPDGTATATAYDADGRRVAETNQDGIVTFFGYDGAGRLASVTDALNQMTRYQYDAAGNEIAQIDALNRTNLYAYDGMGRRIQHALPGGQTELFSYDLPGNLVLYTNFNGAVITNRYDTMNRLTNRSSVFGYSASFGYSPTGQRTSTVDPSGSTAYLYDARDRLTNKLVSFTGGPGVTLSYGYDANGNVTNIASSTSGGANMGYAYDALNRLTNVSANGSAVGRYGFDSVGNLQMMQYGNVLTNTYQYDRLNRLTNLACQAASGTIANFYYQLGLTGNRTGATESIYNGTGTTGRTNQWQYDALYRLTNEVVKAAGTGTLGYGYDAVGNRLTRTAGAGLPSQTLAYNTNDWLATDAYDSDGNTLRSTNGTVSGPYYYDALNHLTNFNGATLFTYDGDGNRASKTAGGVTTYYVLDDRNPSGYAQVLEEYQGSSLNKVYTYGLGLISQKQGGTLYYFIFDGHGSTRLLSDGTGAVQNAFAYDAFGNLIASNSAPQTAYLYCGQQYDPDLGLYYNRARYLSVNTGRFWTMDSYEGDNEDPLGLHKYLYGECDPVDGTDPSGHQDTCEELETETIDEDLESDLDVVTVEVTQEVEKKAIQTAVKTLLIPILAGIATSGGDREESTVWVVRGGLATPEQLTKGTTPTPRYNVFGVASGFSVQSCPGKTVAELAKGGRFFNKQISVSTVKAIRTVSALALSPVDVVSTPNPINSENHCTVTAPYPMPSLLAWALSLVFVPTPNPYPVTK